MIKQVEFMGLNLTLAGIKEKIQLEKALGYSPLKFMFGMAGAASGAAINDGEIDVEDIDFSKMDIPTIPVMVTILHASAQKLNAGVSVEKVMDLVDVWLDQKEENAVFGLFEIVLEVLQTGKYLPSTNEE